MSNFQSLTDSYGRVHQSLRVSVTDRCNIRCTYCMPEQVTFLPKRDLLTFEDIVRFVSVVANHGVNQIRLTGGEPLVRSQLDTLIEMLHAIDGIHEIAITTNAILLAKQADQLKLAGLNRINVSLDTVDSQLFHQVTRRNLLPQVLEGIDAAIDAGFDRIRVNAVPISALPDDSLIELCQFAKSKRLELRFIEFMPLDGDKNWDAANVRSGETLRDLVNQNVGAIEPAERKDPAQPAVDYYYLDDGVQIGFIDSVTSPFCQWCNRIRLTAEGKLRNCLFSNDEWDVKEAIRHGSTRQILGIIAECIQAKKAGHGSNDLTFLRPDRAMYQIGG